MGNSQSQRNQEYYPPRRYTIFHEWWDGLHGRGPPFYGGYGGGSGGSGRGGGGGGAGPNRTCIQIARQE